MKYLLLNFLILYCSNFKKITLKSPITITLEINKCINIDSFNTINLTIINNTSEDISINKSLIGIEGVYTMDSFKLPKTTLIEKSYSTRINGDRIVNVPVKDKIKISLKTFDFDEYTLEKTCKYQVSAVYLKKLDETFDPSVENIKSEPVFISICP